MKRPSATSLLALVLTAFCAQLSSPPSEALAQSFEGVISFEQTSSQITTSFDYYVKGPQVRLEVGASGRQGAAILIDPKKNLATMLVPGSQMYMEFDLTKEAPPKAKASGEGIVLTRTGRTDEIAGRECEEFIASSPSMKGEVWAVSGFGSFLQFDPAPKSARLSLGLEQKLSQQNLFPLRMIVRDLAGKEQSRIEATRIEERSLDARLFTIPAGWKKMDMKFMPK